MIRGHTIRTASTSRGIRLQIKRPHQDARSVKRSYTTTKFTEELAYERNQKVELEEAYKRVWEYNHRLVSELDLKETENKVLKVKLQDTEKREHERLAKLDQLIMRTNTPILYGELMSLK